MSSLIWSFYSGDTCSNILPRSYRVPRSDLLKIAPCLPHLISDPFFSQSAESTFSLTAFSNSLSLGSLSGITAFSPRFLGFLWAVPAADAADRIWTNRNGSAPLNNSSTLSGARSVDQEAAEGRDHAPVKEVQILCRITRKGQEQN